MQGRQIWKHESLTNPSVESSMACMCACKRVADLNVHLGDDLVQLAHVSFARIAQRVMTVWGPDPLKSHRFVTRCRGGRSPNHELMVLMIG